MWKRPLISVFFALVSLILAGCSEPATKSNEQAKKAADKLEEVKPALGEVSFTLPKGWMGMKQAASKTKDVESQSFIRKIDQSLWANPGPVGTANLPMMNITISRRASNASRDDINPKKLSGSLVKQGVITELVQADEIQIANLTATKIVGDSPQQGRIYIILLPNNGFLYKWTLFGTKPSDNESPADLNTLLSSVQLVK